MFYKYFKTDINKYRRSDTTCCSTKKEKIKRDIIKYVDQPKTYLYGVCKASLWKKIITKGDHTLNSHKSFSFNKKLSPLISYQSSHKNSKKIQAYQTRVLWCPENFMLLQATISSSSLPLGCSQSLHSFSGPCALFYSPKIMISQLLSLWGFCSKEGSAGKYKILSFQVKILIYKKIFLFSPYSCYNFFGCCISKNPENPQGLFW